MSTLTIENIPNLCRACLRNLKNNKEQPFPSDGGTQQSSQPIFYNIERLKDLNKWMAIINPLEDMTRLTNQKHYQKYPKLVCRSCYENFKHVNDFKEMVVHSFSVLTKLLATDKEKEEAVKVKNIKIEDNNNRSAATEILQHINVTQGEIVIKSEPIDEDDEVNNLDLEDGEMNLFIDNFSDGLLEENCESQECNNAEIERATNSNRFLKLSKDIKLETTEFIQQASSISPSQLEDEGQPKATKAYKCPICKNSYIHKYTYVAHIRQMHLGIEHAFECEICHKTYTKFCNLYRHMRKEHNQSLRQYKCEYPNCNRSFRQLTTRRKHYEKFHNLEALPDPVEKISQECWQQEQLQISQHASIQLTPLATTSKPKNVKAKEKCIKATPITQNRKNICPLCAASFETSYELKVHMNNLHKADMKFRCHICGILKISQLKLDEHMSTVHRNTKVMCDICKKVLKSKSHLRQHILSVHKGIKPFSCEYCPAKFAAKNTLKVHTRIHTGEKPFKCTICDRRFTQLTPMKKHLITHEKGHRNAIK
ncbi:uncharacterized protein ACRADG_009370 [Cochliomyia hominivorax]